MLSTGEDKTLFYHYGQFVVKIFSFFQRKLAPITFVFSTAFLVVFSIVSFSATRVAYEIRKDLKYWENWTYNWFWSNIHSKSGQVLFSSATPNQIAVFSGNESVLWIHEITALPYVPSLGHMLSLNS